MIQLPPDFKEFLKLLNSHGVKYLVIGGYAVGYYGYPRPTGDLDIWVAILPSNADKLVMVLKEFGFDVPGLAPDLFLQERQVIRLGVPPLRLEILTTIDGVTFDECYAQRTRDVIIDDVPVDFISLAHLKINKKASGRHKDLADLENLP
jgi:predicted nucleotidyltransferase